MTNSAAGEPWRFRNSLFQCSNTRRRQISAICESSLVVSSSGATFASSRSATRVISRPFQNRSAAKSSVAIESPATACNSPSISGYPRGTRHTSGWCSHSSVSGFCVNLVAQMLETARRWSRAGSPSGNSSMRRTSGRASAGHRSLSWSKVVSTCEGFSDAVAFFRIHPFPSSIAKHHADFAQRPISGPQRAMMPGAAPEPAAVSFGFGNQLDSCRPARHRAREERPARS